MEYKVIVENDGNIVTDVINRGKHNCDDIINVSQSFGKIVDKQDKDDNQPVHDRINVKGN